MTAIHFFTKDPSLAGLCTKGTYNGATAMIEEEVVSETHVPMPIYVTGVVRSTLGTAAQREPQPVTGVEPHIMDHIVQQTTPSQNQTQREEYKVYTNLKNNQSLTSSNGFYKYADDLYDKHNSHVYPTPVNVDQLERALKSHPDRLFVQKLCTELREGAKIGYMGPRTSKESRNLPSANRNPDTIRSNLAKEVELGRTAGPFDNPPFPNFQVSPIGLVPKKQPGQFRTIFHLSYPKTGCSINSSIPKEDYSLQYTTIDNAIHAIQALGKGAFMPKTDIQSAFRLFPVHPEDWELLGMKWEGKYYYDKVLPFGLRSAPSIFNQLSDAVEWILACQLAISYVDKILDDFLIMEPMSLESPYDQAARVSLKAMLLTFQALGIPLAPGKTIGPSQVLELLGIELDSNTMEARLPKDKVEKVRQELNTWLNRKSATLQELQSLIGLLNFACKVVPPGRPFLQRMILLTRGVKQSHHHIKLNAGFREDVKMWQKFIDNWNGKNLFLNPLWETSNTLQLFTDAATTEGYGGIFQTSWFQGRWAPGQQVGQGGINIDWQELFAIVVACTIWGQQWSCKRVLFNCDNKPVVDILNSKRSKSPRIMTLVRELTLLTLKYNFYFKAQHIAGCKNDISDSISRFQNSRFRRLAPWADLTPKEIPPHLLTL